MRAKLAMILTKLALALGLYAQRAHLDDATLTALARVRVASKDHTIAKERFTKQVLDQICEAESDTRPAKAAHEAERVGKKMSKHRQNAIDEAFRKVPRRVE